MSIHKRSTRRGVRISAQLLSFAVRGLIFKELFCLSSSCLRKVIAQTTTVNHIESCKSFGSVVSSVCDQFSSDISSPSS